MINFQLPDTEALTLDALRFYLGGSGAGFGVAPPHDWNLALPFAVVYRVGGTSSWAVDHSIISVSTFCAERRAASKLARDIQTALFRAAFENFSSDEGVISKFETIKSPVPVRDGLSGKHAGSFMFDATHEVWSRAHYPV